MVSTEIAKDKSTYLFCISNVVAPIVHTGCCISKIGDISFKCFWSAADTAKTYSFVYSRNRFSLLIFGSKSSNNVSSLKGTTTWVASGNTTSTVLTLFWKES